MSNTANQKNPIDNQQVIADTVQSYLIENFLFSDPDQTIDNDQSLVGSGIIDSAAILSLIFFLEEAFDITVQDDEVIPENIDSLSIIAAYVEKKQAGAESW